MTFQKESGKEGLKILLMLASVIIITAGLQAGKPVLLPIVLSGFLAIVSYPLTTFFKSRLCFPHWLAVTFTVIMDFGFWWAWAIWPNTWGRIWPKRSRSNTSLL